MHYSAIIFCIHDKLIFKFFYHKTTYIPQLITTAWEFDHHLECHSFYETWWQLDASPQESDWDGHPNPKGHAVSSRGRIEAQKEAAYKHDPQITINTSSRKGMAETFWYDRALMILRECYVSM